MMETQILKIILTIIGVVAVASGAYAGKIRVLILSGANNHDWKATTPVLEKIYTSSGRFEVTVTTNVPALTGADFAKFDVLVSNYTTYPNMTGQRWTAEVEKAFLDYIAAGHGLVSFHAASTAWSDWPEFGDLVGVTWLKGTSGHGAQHAFKVTFLDHEHPVTKGLKDFTHVKDELYHRQVLHPTAKVLATAFDAPGQRGSGTKEPMIVVTEYGKGRGFYNAMGHDPKPMADPQWQKLMLRGTEWAATGTVDSRN
jgi:uncharacterized protein